MVENASAMASRLDTTVVKTGTSKRDIDYVQEYTGFLRDFDAAKAAGTSEDDVLAKVKATLGIAQIEADMDAFYAKRAASVKA